MNKKGLLSGITTIVWSVLLILILAIYGFMFIQEKHSLETEAITESNAVFWEPGYLAHQLAIQPYKDTTIHNYLSTHEELSDDELESLEEEFISILEKTVLPLRPYKATPLQLTKREEAQYVVFIAKGETNLCVVVPENKRRSTICNYNINRDVDTSMEYYMLDGLASGVEKIKQQHETNGGVGVIPLPGETPGVFGVVMFR